MGIWVYQVYLAFSFFWFLFFFLSSWLTFPPHPGLFLSFTFLYHSRLISLFLSMTLLPVTVLCQLLSCSFLFASFTRTPSVLSPFVRVSPLYSTPPFRLSQFNLPSCTFPFFSLLYLSLQPSTVRPKVIMYVQEYVGWYVCVNGYAQPSRCTGVWCDVVAAAPVCLFTSHSHLEFISNAFASGASLTSTHSQTHMHTHVQGLSLCFPTVWFSLTHITGTTS